jgi:pyocin large subunit-like protein
MTTIKYSKHTNEIAFIKKDGTVITYFKPKDGIKYFFKVIKKGK